ncbi:SDR family NAD(P)-dependent oxidoreductase [Skermania sp. ID1734]|uniref:SDR family NAD(P)-dependent oxidoreductase n=1 Tax=Skermania sp. ID1734 TaxID=2597516 RepID=UPI00117E903C|nr:SDR family NAD(P)-dependent oxidoreductase [Skermania sp. ID1734]TSE01450.1 SDR family NAD(P)-dependent oxidoreductase [Skermania sp. ID1734]
MATDKPLAGSVALVTGASRGIGKGIALELGAAGALVYVTARDKPNRVVPGSLPQTVADAAELGGRAIAVPVDHTDDAAVSGVFAKIRDEAGRLDVLVNNVYNSPASARWLGKPFWEMPPQAWDAGFDVGVRSHYVAAAAAVPIMLAQGRGLIVNISSPGAVRYMHNVVYGVGKAALDRMTADMAHELAGTGVAVVSLWPGVVDTELLQLVPRDTHGKRIVTLPGEGSFDLDRAETPRFVGRAVVALATDVELDERTGRSWTTAELAREYGFTDVDARTTP